MDYTVAFNWGGLHGDIGLQRETGELLYLLKASDWPQRHFAVLDAGGTEVSHIRITSPLLGRAYLIQSDGSTVGRTRTNWCWSRGYIEVADLPAASCRYGWGIKPILIFVAAGKPVASATLHRGVGVRWLLCVEDAAFDLPRFLVGCALILRDWSSRG